MPLDSHCNATVRCLSFFVFFIEKTSKYTFYAVRRQSNFSLPIFPAINALYKRLKDELAGTVFETAYSTRLSDGGRVTRVKGQPANGLQR